MTIEHETSVLVVGGGPAGLLAALELARTGTRCMLVERNEDTTRWPKMDLTNARSMEIFRRLEIAESFREQAVPKEYSLNVLFSTGLSEGGELITQWDLDSPEAMWERIKNTNDGSMPREPWLRCSQAIFEAWLKPRLQAEPLVDSHFGMKFESLVETVDGVESTLVDVASDEKHVVRSKYVVGCDGAGSRVRRCLDINLTGGPTPMALYLVHFKSKDMARLRKQGQFWHIFLSGGAAIINQDEVDTFTVHTGIPLDLDISTLDPEETVFKALGGSSAPYPIKIDKILVTSSWRPNICIANSYRSPGGRVFLSGDSAHQNIPTGGYGMNTAIIDSFDIGWKLSAILAGWGGPHLLDAYEAERKPVAVRNIDLSGKHMSVHMEWWGMCGAAGPDITTSQNEEGKALRAKIAAMVTERDGENKASGVELGYRYTGSPVIVPDPEEPEPEWDAFRYIPSTWPGARAPHVFLSDGKTSIFDLFGQGYTLVDFSTEAKLAAEFKAQAKKLSIPLKIVHLPTETHARSIWGRDAVLVRPDDHVAWRAPSRKDAPVDVEDVLLIAVGKRQAEVKEAGGELRSDQVSAAAEKEGFSGTIGHVDQDKVAMRAEFQK